MASFDDDPKEVERDFKQVEASGAPAKRKIKNAESAWRLLEEMKDDAYEKSRQWARIQGIYDRNPPYPPGELERQGRGYQTNVNTGEMESVIDSNAAAAHEAILEVSALAQFRIEQEFIPAGESRNFSDIMSDEYTQLLRNWDGFYFNGDFANKESFKYGLGVMLWPGELDWRPKAYKSSSFLYPAKSRIATDELEMFAMRDEISPRKLFDAIQDPEEATKAGWNVPYVKRVLIETYFEGSGGDEDDEYGTSTFESLQQKIKNNDPDTEKKEFSGVRVAHIAVHESSSGRVSHMIIPEDMTEKEFLFDAPDRFPSMSSLLWILPYDYGDGYLRSIKGLGHRAFMHTDLSNRLFSSIMDGGLLSSGLLVQPGSGSSLSNLELTRVGPLTVVPPGVNIVQSSFTPPLKDLIPLRQMSSELLNNNLGVFRARNENPFQRDVEKTAAQVRSEVSKEARFQKNQAALRYVAWDKWHREVFRRLTNPDYILAGFEGEDVSQQSRFLLQRFAELRSINEIILESGVDFPGRESALRFILNCLKRGVPPEILFNGDATTITATRAIGLGSESIRQQALSELMQARGSMDELSRRNTEREWAAALIGGHFNVDRFFPLASQDTIPSNQTTMAVLENNDMAEGSSLPVGADQMHSEHIKIHMASAMEIIQLFVQEPDKIPDVQKSLQFLVLVIPHMQQHLAYLSSDPSREQQVKQLASALQQIVAVTSQIQSRVQKIESDREKAIAQRESEIQDLRARADENSIKLEVERMKIEKQFELDAAETQTLNATRLAKMEASIQALLQKTQAGIEASHQKLLSDLTNDRIKAEAGAQKTRTS